MAILDSIGGLFRGAADAVGGLLKGTADTAVNVLNSDAVEQAINSGAQLAAAKFTAQSNESLQDIEAKKAAGQQAALPSWTVPAMIGGLLVILLLLFRRK